MKVARAELSMRRSTSDEAAATLQRELVAARQALADALARNDVDKDGNHDEFLGKKHALDLEHRTTISDTSSEGC